MTIQAEYSKAVCERETGTESLLFRAALSATIVGGTLNGISIRVWQSIQHDGLLHGVNATFGISVIAWFSLYLLYDLFRTAKFPKPNFLDKAALAASILLMLFPLPSASWVGLTIVSLRFLFRSGVNDDGRRLFVALLALAGAMQWARWVSQIFMPTILDVDALLVSTLSGYARHGNLVQAGDGSTTLEILEACSSFQNASLAVLGWINARCYFNTHGLRRGAAFLLLMIGSVVFINTTRIALIAYRPDLYELIHGNVGGAVANTLSTIAIISLAFIGARK